MADDYLLSRFSLSLLAWSALPAASLTLRQEVTPFSSYRPFVIAAIEF